MHKKGGKERTYLALVDPWIKSKFSRLNMSISKDWRVREREKLG
jgi:hypothetical protein